MLQFLRGQCWSSLCRGTRIRKTFVECEDVDGTPRVDAVMNDEEGVDTRTWPNTLSKGTTRIGDQRSPLAESPCRGISSIQMPITVKRNTPRVSSTPSKQFRIYSLK